MGLKSLKMKPKEIQSFSVTKKRSVMQITYTKTPTVKSILKIRGAKTDVRPYNMTAIKSGRTYSKQVRFKINLKN